MESEKMLVDMGYAIRKRVTGREEFLRTMNYVIPWAEWVQYVRPFVPDEEQEDRRVNLLLRMYLLQKWFGLSDAQVEDTIYDSYAMWLFVGMNTMEEGLPKRETYTAFRHGLERSDANMLLTEAVENFLRRYGRKMVCGSVTEAAIVQDMEEPPVYAADPAKEREADAPRIARTAARSHRSMGFDTPQGPPVRSAQDEETIRSLEERLSRLEAEKAHEARPVHAPHVPLDAVPSEEAQEETYDNAFEEMPQRSGWGIFGRILLTLIVLVLLAGAALTVYDYTRTGIWLRWFDLPFINALGSVPGETVPPSLATEPESVIAQRIMPTPAPTATLSSWTPEPVATQSYGSLLQALADTGAAGGAVQEIHAGTLGGVPYDADADIERNLSRLASGAEPAAVIASEAATGRKISLTIDGMHDAETMRGILALLAAHSMEATFFPTGLQTADTPEIVREIAGAGHPVGNYTLRGEASMQTLDRQTLVESFTMAGKIIEVVTGQQPTRLKANATEYTQEVLLAAGACGLDEVVQSTAFITYHSFKSYEETLAYVNRLPYGSIVSVKLSGVLDASEYQPVEVIEQPAIDKEANVSTAPSVVTGLSEAERLLLVLQWLLEAVDNADFSPESALLKEANGGALQVITQSLYTTQPAVAYTFYGEYGRAGELAAVKANLKAVGGIGTFFVTVEDLSLYPQELQGLIDAGHSLGLSIPIQASQDFFAVCHQLHKAREEMVRILQYTPRHILLSGGTATDALREAASAMDMLLIGADLTFTRDETQNASTPEEIIQFVYGENVDGFQRGKILRFRLGFLADETMLGSLITTLDGTRNAYSIIDVYALATNTAYLYTYPLPDDQILPEVKNRIYPGQLKLTGDALNALLLQRYIGNPAIIDGKRLPGFSRQEIYALDRKGKISGASNTAFLTFDDWGTDVPVTKLLDVLRKHNVKATFFVRTEYVENNPNLLRAIAMEGHEIASHTHTHMALANAVGDTWEFEELTDGQLAALRADIQTSWNVLQSIVGDVRLETGAPALSTLFRPPTLAVSKSGMEAVLDMGMSYIVNGEYTSQDYMAESVDALRRNLRLNIWDGTITVLHFSDNAIYTADALDEYFTLNTAGKNRKVYSYARLSDYLQGTADISAAK